MKKRRHQLIKILVLALLIRISIFYFQYSGDIGNHLVWGKGVLDGTIGFFSKKFPGFNDANYPPVIIYLFGLSAWLYKTINQSIIFFNQNIAIFPSNLVPIMSTLNMQSAFMKLPCILADIGIGWLIYELSPAKRDKTKLILSSLFLFNPAIIYLSTIWGQIESLPIFFILLSFYFLSLSDQKNQSKNRSLLYYYLSHISFTFAFLSKQTALWVLPIMLIIWFKKRDFLTFIKGGLVQLLFFILLYFPFTHKLTDPFIIYVKTLSGSTTLAAEDVWNLWYFILPPGTEDLVIWSGLSIRHWSLIILGIIYFLVCWRLFSKFNKQNPYISLFIISLAAFFIQTRVHEKHLAPALPFLLLFPKSKKLFLSLLS